MLDFGDFQKKTTFPYLKIYSDARKDIPGTFQSSTRFLAKNIFFLVLPSEVGVHYYGYVPGSAYKFCTDPLQNLEILKNKGGIVVSCDVSPR